MDAGAEPDTALVDASRRGDRTAFARLVERYQRVVYAVAFSNVRDPTLSDDVTQDTFVAAWRRLHDLRDTSRLAAWLCGIARNLARAARKRRRRERPGDVPEAEAAQTPFDALSDADSERLIAAALARIPDLYREPLVLFYYEQRCVEDVARTLGITARTTNKRLSRGRRYLADRVTDMVERGLARRGPKRDLVACVLAAIGVLGSASQADASPAAPKGSTMLPKLTLATVLATTILVGGVRIMSAGASRERAGSPPRRQVQADGRPGPGTCRRAHRAPGARRSGGGVRREAVGHRAPPLYRDQHHASHGHRVLVRGPGIRVEVAGRSWRASCSWHRPHGVHGGANHRCSRAQAGESIPCRSGRRPGVGNRSRPTDS